MISSIIGVITGSLGKLIGIGVAVIAIGGYMWYLSSSLDSALADKKEAEDNVVLIVREFDNLYLIHEIAIANSEKDKEFYRYNVVELKKNHEVEIDRAIYNTKMREEVRHANPKDDRNISNVLRNTIESLRMYK